jgi:lipoate synthase
MRYPNLQECIDHKKNFFFVLEFDNCQNCGFVQIAKGRKVKVAEL